MPSLTIKQTRFVQEYLLDLNATQAAIRAGYSVRTAASIGHENLRKPEIARAIAEDTGARAARLGITTDRVLEELAKIAFSDIRQVATWTARDLTLKPASELSHDQSAIVSQIAQTADGRLSVKLHSKLDALEKLARHLGLYDRSEVESEGEERKPRSPYDLEKELSDIDALLDECLQTPTIAITTDA